ncbi:MAG: FkbM family methyltransferase [Actinomycetota bacterium]|nr:FkbM family methyltransferase [Actinomycetota bacterium]
MPARTRRLRTLRTVAEGLRKVGKLARLSPRADYLRALRHGVAAAVEHERVPFDHDFATVVDVGAGRGQFALVARRRYPSASLHCFEPLAHAREKLAAVVGEARVHAVALGSTNTPAHFHVSEKGDSSSLLPITDRQVETFPGTGEVGQIVVNRARLDEIIAPQALARPSLLKIDVQGYELEVLQGTEHVIHLIDDVFVECSFEELYAGQPLADEVVCYLRAKGFELAGVFSVARDEAGRCLQADFHFRRRGSLEAATVPS